MTASKLGKPRPEGEGWTEEQVKTGVRWYKNFLKLCAKYPLHNLMPGEPIEAVWRAHILDTRKYADDCQHIFGYFIHHFPYFGMASYQPRERALFVETDRLFMEEFGEDCRATMLVFEPSDTENPV